MQSKKWTDGEIRALIRLHAHTDHALFKTQDAECAFYAGIIGRPVSTATLWRLQTGRWYIIDETGNVAKSPKWAEGQGNKPKPKPEPEANLWAFEPEAPKRLEAMTAAEIIEAMGAHLRALDELNAQLRALSERGEDE